MSRSVASRRGEGAVGCAEAGRRKRLAPVLDGPLSLRPILIHLHVPKCAGSSVNAAMAEHFEGRYYSRSNVHAPSGQPKLKDIPSEEIDRRYDAMFGHFRFGVHRRFNRDYFYFSIARDPIERMCSLFNFVHTRPAHFAHKFLKENLCDLNELNEDTLRMQYFQRAWQDAFCRAYSGWGDEVDHDNFTRVRRRVVRHCRAGKLFIADVPQVQELLSAIGMGELPRQNVTDTSAFDDFRPAKAADLKPQVRDLMVSRLCGFDYRLLDEVRQVTRQISARELGARLR